MAIEEDTLYLITGEQVTRSSLVQEMINYYALKLEVGETKVTDFNEGSEIRNLLEAFAVDLYFVMENQNELSMIGFIETAEGEWLDKHGANPWIGIERDEGQEATGFVTFSLATASETEVSIPEETIISCVENDLDYMTDSEAIIGVGETSVTVGATCLTEGEDGNCSPDTLTVLNDDSLDIPGLSVSNSDAFIEGTDYEEDDEYRERLLSFVRQASFGSKSYYLDLGASIDGVHDINLIPDEDGDFTAKVLVNGDVKPTPDSVLVDVLEAFTEPENIVLRHNFGVFSPSDMYVTVDLDITLNVIEALDEEEILTTLSYFFDGGGSDKEFQYDGFYIGEPLTKTKLYSCLELLDGVNNVYVEVEGSEIDTVDVTQSQVIKMGTVNITQNIVEDI